MSCINCNENKCNCQCVTSTTTICTETYPIPCIDVCSGDYFDTSCIIYDGPDFNCYGLKNGDSLKDILNLILEKLNLSDCSCDFGPSISQLITTTTSSTSTTTTTTLPITPSLCFNLVIEEVGESTAYSCLTENKVINPGSIVNGKYSYAFTYDLTDYIIKWSSSENRWELYNTTANPDFLVAFLESTNSYPLGPLEPNVSASLKWENSDGGPALVATRLTCPASICVEIETEQNTDIISFLSFYNILDGYPIGTTTNHPVYFSYCEVTQPPVYSIKFNSFTNVYELYEGINKIAFASQSNIETVDFLNWVILPSYSGSYISIKSKICPSVMLQ